MAKTKKLYKKQSRGFFNSLFRFLFLSGIFLAIIFAILTAFFQLELPDIESLPQNSKVINNLSVKYSNKRLIKRYGAISTNSVIYSEIPTHMIEALVATEDRRFFEHHGIDIRGIARAMVINIKAGQIRQGGSTITQQLAKMMFLTKERTFKRKFQEAILAIKLEQLFSKEQIITFYLNKAYFGAGKYGIMDASLFYFNKHVSELILEESAMLIGLLKAPNKYSPINNPELAKLRADQIIANMADAGFIEKEEAINTIASRINYTYTSATYNKQNQAYYFSDWIKNQVYDFIDKDNDNISIITTLDYDAQNIIEDTVYNFIETYKTKLGKTEIALIAMSKDGAILAMIGGKNYDKSPFNRSIYAYRQPGSAFKLFVYLTALQKGYNINDILIDEPIAVGNWYPENYNQEYFGEVTMKEAFARSLNSVAVQISEACQPKNVIKTARKLGITAEMDPNDPTIALGSTQLNLMDLTASYATIANNGYPVIPYYIKEIRDINNDVIYKRHSSGLNRVIDKKDVQYMKEMLFEVINSGTGTNARIKNWEDEVSATKNRFFSRNKFDIGGKTGTSQDYQDAWFIGYYNDLVIGIWMGNDDNTPTNNIVGGSLPAILWRETIQNIND